MKKFSLLFYLACIGLLRLNAQIVSNVDFVQIQNNNSIEITYSLISDMSNQSFNVSVYLSKDGGITFESNALENVSGDVGEDVSPGVNNKIIWDVFNEEALEDKPEFGDTLVFKITVNIVIAEAETKERVPETRERVIEQRIREEVDRQYVLGYKGSYFAPIGIVVGLSGKPGFYLSPRLNTKFFKKCPYEIKDGDPSKEGFIIKDINYYEIKRFSLTAGVQWQLNEWLHGFAGIGLNQHTEIQQIVNEAGNVVEWAKNLDYSFTSYEVEIGLLLQIQKIFIGAGIANYHKNYFDFSFSAGILL